jgi:hypothetical protein
MTWRAVCAEWLAMMRVPLFTLLAAFAAAIPAPAQVFVEGRFGRNPRTVISIGNPRHDHRPVDRVDRRVDHDHQAPRDRRGPVLRAPAPRGHWRTIEEPFLVPGYWHEQHVPPTWGWIHDRCGRRRWGIVDHGGCRQVWVEARWEMRTRQVWVPC